MGAPELPTDPGEEDLTFAQIQHPPITNSDESDNEINDIYGYQPLPMNSEDGDNEDTNVEHFEYDLAEHETETNDDSQATMPFSNLPQVETVNAEIERQIWNEPRPQELQIELDSTRTSQILNAMANFTLPTVYVPPWAAGVPEDCWKEELLQRIRQRRTDNEVFK